MVEHLLPKQGVESSILFSRSNFNARPPHEGSHEAAAICRRRPRGRAAYRGRRGPANYAAPERLQPLCGRRHGSFAAADPLANVSHRNLLQHKSGGPIMWSGDSENGEAITYWFEDNFFPTPDLFQLMDSSDEKLPQMYPLMTGEEERAQE